MTKNFKQTILNKFFSEIASSRHNIPQIEALMFKVNEEFGLPEEQFQNLMIAVTEIVSNAIVHGNKENPDKKVSVTVEYDSQKMYVKVTDEGNGFDIYNIPNPTLPENITKSSGRGIFIVKSLVDDFSYRHTEKGSEFILLVKKR